MSGIDLTDIVASALKNEQERLNSYKSTDVHKDVELDFDVGTLLASDYSALDMQTLR